MSSRRQVNRRTPGSVATADSSHDKMGDQRLVEFLSEITAVEEEANLKSHGQSFANAHELQNATFRLLLREETREIGNVQLFVNLIFILYARWRIKIVCLQTKLASLAIRLKYNFYRTSIFNKYCSLRSQKSSFYGF